MLLQPQPRPKLWISWALATALGAVAGAFVAMAIGLVVTSEQGLPTLRPVSLGETWHLFLPWLVAGTVAGFGQWLILRHYVPSIQWLTWVSATGGGYLLCVVMYFVGLILVGVSYILVSGMMLAIFGLGRGNPSAARLGVTPFDFVMPSILWGLLFAVGVVSWLAIGLVQCLVLRRYVRKAAQWVLAHAALGAIGQIISLTAALTLISQAIVPADAPVLGWGIMFFVGGIVTGLLLVHLLRSPIEQGLG